MIAALLLLALLGVWEAYAQFSGVEAMDPKKRDLPKQKTPPSPATSQ